MATQIIQGVEIEGGHDKKPSNVPLCPGPEVQLHHDPAAYYKRRLNNVTSAALQCFPNQAGLGVWSQVECALPLPSPVTEDVVAQMNAIAERISVALLASLAGGANGRIKQEQQAYLGSVFLPTVPTLLPDDFGLDPVKSMRRAARHLRQLLAPAASAEEAQKEREAAKASGEEDPLSAGADLALRYFPGYARISYGHGTKDFRLRKFVIEKPTRQREGGYVTCEAWSLTTEALKRASAVAQVPHVEDATVVYAQQILALASRFGSVGLMAHLATFNGADIRTDYLKAWIAIISTLHATRAPSHAFSALARDDYYPPTISAAEMPTYQIEPVIAQADPYMPHAKGKATPRPHMGQQRQQEPTARSAQEWAEHGAADEEIEAGAAGW